MWDQSVAPFQNGLALIWRDTGLIGLSCHLELFLAFKYASLYGPFPFEGVLIY